MNKVSEVNFFLNFSNSDVATIHQLFVNSSTIICFHICFNIPEDVATKLENFLFYIHHILTHSKLNFESTFTVFLLKNIES